MSGRERADTTTVEERIVSHLAFARAVAARSLDPRCRGADREDLIASGVFGLVHAAGALMALRARRARLNWGTGPSPINTRH